MDDLLQIARLDSNTQGRSDPVDLGQLAATELDRRKRRIRIVREIEPGVVVPGDRLRLARVLTNLVDNAERHANSVVVIRVYMENGEAVMEVLDDGAGVPPDKREHVFQRFTRLDAARSRDAGGTGLGLAIARQISEGHGGSLCIEDSPKGARFILRIPVLALGFRCGTGNRPNAAGRICPGSPRSHRGPGISGTPGRSTSPRRPG